MGCSHSSTSDGVIKSQISSTQMRRGRSTARVNNNNNNNNNAYAMWSKTKDDARMMVEDLEKNQPSDISQALQDYKDLLSRWLRRFKDADPMTPRVVAAGDPNLQPFPIPVSPDGSLRTWLRNYEPFDTLLPSGQSPWQVFPDDVVNSDCMTTEQEKTHAARAKRSRHDDPVRMRKSRERLGMYFQVKYHLSPGVMKPYLWWADVMEKNMEHLQELCQKD